MSIDGQPALDRLSPLAVARGWGRESAVVGHMPAATLVHGTRDKSAPHVGSVQLHEALLVCVGWEEMWVVVVVEMVAGIGCCTKCSALHACKPSRYVQTHAPLSCSASAHAGIWR